MRVVMLGIALGQLETPCAVFTHDRVYKIALYQPVQHSIQRYAVKRGFLGKCVQEFLVSEWMFSIKQNIQHRNT